MKVLVTGSRAPVALDLCRALAMQDFTVYSGDSVQYPLTRFSSHIKRHFTLPSPRHHPESFFLRVKEIIKEHDIDWLIPTCEEVFFLSHNHASLAQSCQLFFDPLDTLSLLHDKYRFSQFATQFSIKVPRSRLINRRDELNSLQGDLVLKPVFSRFGDKALIKPKLKSIKRLRLDKAYLAQEFIKGRELCHYALALDGKLLSQVTYLPTYRAGKAGIYFEETKNSVIEHFSQEIIKALNYSGQISFDFIENEQGCFVIECNPRATSGLHLRASELDWQGVFSGQVQKVCDGGKPKMLGFAMASFGLKYLLSQQAFKFCRDIFRGRDVIKGHDSPFIYVRSYKSLLEIFTRMIKKRQTFKSASTEDIEWNGEDLS